MKRFVRGMVDLICFAAGPFFTAYYIFDFAHGPDGPGPFYYFYRNNSRFGLALGVTLVCLGFLIRHWRTREGVKS